MYPWGYEVSYRLPARAMFDFSVPVKRRRHRLVIDGDLTEWPPDFCLPDLGALDDQLGFGRVWMAWDAHGLYFALEVNRKQGVMVDPKRPHKGDALFLWIDTRDVRDAVSAGRFCHYFIVLPRIGHPREKCAWQEPIPQAREQAPICDPSQLKTACCIRRDGYSLELAIPAPALNGYDPAECPRLGMTYRITDVRHGEQLWNVPVHLPFEHDPSTWASIELID